jgi:hypothetical protein
MSKRIEVHFQQLAQKFKDTDITEENFGDAFSSIRSFMKSINEKTIEYSEKMRPMSVGDMLFSFLYCGCCCIGLIKARRIETAGTWLTKEINKLIDNHTTELSKYKIKVEYAITHFPVKNSPEKLEFWISK